MQQNIQLTPHYSGIKYIDIDSLLYMPTDYETNIIPSKGDIICFSHMIGNDSTYYHWEVLYIYNNFTSYGEKNIEDSDIKQVSVSVIMKKIEPILGEETYRSIYELIKK